MTMAKINVASYKSGSNRYLFAIGNQGFDPRYILAYGNDIQSALSEAIEWIAQNDPKLLANDVVQELFDEALESGLEQYEAWEEATIDTTSNDDGDQYICSDDWSIVLEEPTTLQLMRFLKAA
jgi:hypothetical protein